MYAMRGFNNTCIYRTPFFSFWLECEWCFTQHRRTHAKGAPGPSRVPPQHRHSTSTSNAARRHRATAPVKRRSHLEPRLHHRPVPSARPTLARHAAAHGALRCAAKFFTRQVGRVEAVLDGTAALVEQPAATTQVFGERAHELDARRWAAGTWVTYASSRTGTGLSRTSEGNHTDRISGCC